MEQAVSETIFLLLGIIVGISLVSFVAFIGSISSCLDNNKINKEAKVQMMEKAADAQPYADISRLITGDDIVEFITDNGALYNYYIKFKDGTITEITKDSTDYNKAKEAVKSHLPSDMLEGEAEAYASTALWSQYYLSHEIFGDKVSNKYRPVILVNRTGKENSLSDNGYAEINGTNKYGWSKYKDEVNQIQYTFLDIIDTGDEFVIVYEEQ